MSSSGRPVKAALARGCMEQYEVLYTGKDYTQITSAFTKSVRFDGPSLTAWMSSLSATDYNNIRVCFGVYTNEFQKEYAANLKETSIGRLTAFLCAYNDDTPAKYVSAAKRDGDPDDGDPNDGDPNDGDPDDGDPDDGDVDPFNMGSLEP
ncbi:hypothetical protein [Hufsiella ginkgonis]|uniref:Uncharacterized protein n=1 Tax=Hufsiella ginkgonis TaxID=2695274 RepID=A0A7K1XTC0_9SPHI|nr:hypothetical protein [Hufsiella ginkgonis]MXV14204.1 hypothetical protein [Hufsiella ginkgonis]